MGRVLKKWHLCMEPCSWYVVDGVIEGAAGVNVKLKFFSFERRT
jgi:hypothetical protein